MFSDVIRQRTRDIDVKRYCVQLIDKCGSFAYTRDILTQLDRQAREEVARLGGNAHMEAILDSLLGWKDES